MKKEIAVVACAVLASMSYADITSVALDGTVAVDVNLTTEGTTDWVMLGRDGAPTGLTNRDEKVGVDYIGAVTVTGTQDSWTGHPNRYDWTDGDITGTGVLEGTQELGNWEAKPLTGLATTDQALTFSVSGLAVGDYSMKLYTGSYTAAQLLSASMNGGTSMTASHDLSNDITSYSVAFTIDDGSDILDIAFNRNDTAGNQYSNVSISAVTLAAVPEPATLGLIGAFGGGLLFIRRRFMV